MQPTFSPTSFLPVLQKEQAHVVKILSNQGGRGELIGSGVAQDKLDLLFFFFFYNLGRYFCTF